MKNQTTHKLWCLVVFLCITMVSVAQERTTNETKIVVVINTDNHTVSHVQLLNTFLKKEKTAILKKYPKHSFFYGVLKGKYKLQEDEISPLAGTTIVVHTESQLFPEHNFYADKELLTGDSYTLGKIKTEVVNKKKGELILIAQ